MNNQERYKRLAELGANLNGNRIRAAESRVERNLEDIASNTEGAKSNKWSKGALSILLNWTTIIGMFMIVMSFLLLLFAFPVQEYSAVYTGLLQVKDAVFLSRITALFLVLALIAMLFMEFTLKDSAKDEELYKGIKWAVKFVESSIIIFGVMGRLNIESYESYGDLFKELVTPATSMSITGTLFTSLAAIWVTRYTVLFVYQRFVSLYGKFVMEENTSFLDGLREELLAEELDKLIIQAEAMSNSQE